MFYEFASPYLSIDTGTKGASRGNVANNCRKDIQSNSSRHGAKPRSRGHQATAQAVNQNRRHQKKQSFHVCFLIGLTLDFTLIAILGLEQTLVGRGVRLAHCHQLCLRNLAQLGV